MHWNFFFTLAGVSILTTIINIPPQYSGIFGTTILVGIVQLNYILLASITSESMISSLSILFCRVPVLVDVWVKYLSSFKSEGIRYNQPKQGRNF